MTFDSWRNSSSVRTVISDLLIDADIFEYDEYDDFFGWRMITHRVKMQLRWPDQFIY